MSTCLDDNGLADIFGAATNDDHDTVIDAHVVGCESCRRLVATYAHLFGDPPRAPAGEEDSEVAPHE